MKTIGVLGGIGPQATMDFEVRLHRAAQALIPSDANRGYPPMVVMYHRQAPVLLDDKGAPVTPLTVDPRLLAAAKRLGALVDFLVLTSNSPHVFQREIEEAAGKKILSIVDLVLDEVERRGWRRIGLLGLGKPMVYAQPLEKRGLDVLLLDEETRTRVDREIFRVMEGRNDSNSRAVAEQALIALRAQSVDGIILGCTEIPFMLGKDAEAPDLLSPLDLLAEAAVKFAME